MYANFALLLNGAKKGVVFLEKFSKDCQETKMIFEVREY